MNSVVKRVNMQSPALTLYEGEIWVALSSVSERLCKKGSLNVRSAARRWLLENIGSDNVKVLRIGGYRRPLLCVRQSKLHIAGIYAAYLGTGRDFRAKWADLPNKPEIPLDTRLELAWTLIPEAHSNAYVQKKAGVSWKNVIDLFEIQHRWVQLKTEGDRPSLIEAITTLREREKATT